VIGICLFLFFFGFNREYLQCQRKSYSRRARRSACVSACGGSGAVGTSSSQAVPSWYLPDHFGIRSSQRPRDQGTRESGKREADFPMCHCVHLFCIQLLPDNYIGVARQHSHSHSPSERGRTFLRSHLLQYLFHLAQIRQTNATRNGRRQTEYHRPVKVYVLTTNMDWQPRDHTSCIGPKKGQKIKREEGKLFTIK